MLGGWNLGAGGCRGDVIGPEQEASEKQVSLFILILFAVPAGGVGVRVRGGGGVVVVVVLAVGQGKGCWEMAKDAKQAPPPTLEAHIFVLRNLVCCQRPHFGSMA